jgi:peptide/nickel transport system substrate-binding protein
MAAKPGGTLKYGTYIRAPGLDPIKTASYDAASIYTPVYSKLFRSKLPADLKPYSPWKQEVVPDLASGFENPSPGVVVIKIRQGVKWHNAAPVNGRNFTADDAKFTLEAFAKSPEFKEWLPIDKADVVDATTLRVTLREPINYLIPALAENRIVMLAKEVGEADGDFNKRVIGTGPFTLEQYTPGTTVNLKKNPAYYLQGKPYLDAVEYVPYKDEASARAAYIAGQFQATRGEGVYDPQNYKNVLNQTKDSSVGYLIQSRWQCNVWFVGLKGDKAPFTDPRVTQAISKGWDRLGFAKIAFEGLKPNLYGPLSWVEWFDKEPDISSITKYDPADAKRLLQAAGITGDLKIPMEYANYGQATVDQFLYMVEQLKGIGVQIEPKLYPTPEYIGRFTPGLFEYGALGFTATVPRYGPLLMKSFLQTGGARNALRVSDPEIDSNIKKLTETTNAAEQKAAYQAVWNKAILRPYFIGLVEAPTIIIHNKKVHNWLFNMWNDYSGWGHGAMFEQAWLEA